jgi:hypothetical protein
LPAWLGRDVVSYQGAISGNGVVAQESLVVWEDWWLSAEVRNVRIQLGNDQVWMMRAKLQEYAITAERGEKVNMAVSIVSDGEVEAIPVGGVIHLSNSTVVSSAAIGSLVGTLSVVGGSGTYTYSLTSNPGGLFAIAGSALNVAAALTAGSKPITISASNGVDPAILNTFTITVAAAIDTTPDPFTFTDVTNAALSTVVESNTITVTGINTPATMTVTGGQYSKNGGSYASASTTVAAGNTVKVRGTSSASNSTAVNVTLTIGGVSDTFTITTLAFVSDTTPNPFTFTDATNVAPSSLTESNAITVTGINAPATMTITGGQYQINGGAWASTSTTVVVNDTVKVRTTSSASNSTAVNVVLTIGGVSDTFTITTFAADTTPNAFSFTDVTGAAVSTVVESNAITVSGINVPATMTITGGEYQINGGAWASASTTVVVTNTVKVRGTSSALNSTAVNVVLTIGGVSDTFSITTAAASATLAPTIDLVATSDKGLSSTDNITNDNTPAFDVVCMTTPVVGDTIAIAKDGTIVTSAVLTAGDIAGTTVPSLGTTTLADGTYTFTARHTNAGSTSAYSAGLSVTIDTVAPVLTAPSGGQNITVPSDVDLSVTTDSGQGKIYWMIQDATWAAPTAQQVIDHIGTADLLWVASGRYGTIDVSTTGAKTASGTISVSGDFRVYYTHTDTAGNNAAVVTPTNPWTQTIAAFTANGVGGFDGTNTYMANTSVSGIADSKKGLVSFWVKMLGGATTDRYVFTMTTSTAVKLWCYIDAASVLNIVARNSSSVNVFSLKNITAGTPFASPPTGWIHVGIWWDVGLATPTAKIFLNGVLNTASGAAPIDSPVNYATTTCRIGANQATTPGLKFFGSMSELYINLHDTLDLSVAANMQKFRSSSGNPVPLGPTGLLPIPAGAPPEFYLGDNNTFADWGTNNGSKGNFTTPAGALTSVTGPP